MGKVRVLVAVAAWLAVVTGTTTIVWTVLSEVSGRAMLTGVQSVIAIAPTSGPSAPQPPPSPPPPVSPQPGTSPAPHDTWQGPSGAVVAACDGDAVELVSAQPANGFRAEVESSGPHMLEVAFTRVHKPATGVKVVAHCVSGAVTFTSEPEED
jgi:hypothetical protein